MQLDLLTLNLWDLPWPVSRARGRRLPRAFDWLRGRHDVVGLQELWRKRPPLFDRPLFHRPEAGLGLLAHGLGETRYHPFRARRGVERFKRKGVLAAVLDELDVVVGVLHTQAGSPYGRIRREQLEEADGWMRDLAGRRPIVLMGDVNLDDSRADDRDTATWMERRGWQDVHPDEPTFAPCNPWVSKAHGARLDRIYLLDGDRPLVAEHAEVVLKHEPVSDHYGLHALVRVG